MNIGIFTDSHYSSAEVTCGKRYNSRSLEKIQEALTFFKDGGCELVICLGDLIDKEKETDLAVQNLKKISDVIKLSGLRVISLMGNHDAVVFSRDDFYAILGEECRPRTISYEGKTFLFVDACYSANGEPYSPQMVTRFDWTDTFVPDVARLADEIREAEENVYLFIHQNIDQEVREDHRISNDRQLREILEASGKVKAVYQGHFHPGHVSRAAGIDYVTFPAMCEGELTRFILEL